MDYRKPYLYEAFFSIFSLVVIMAVGIIRYEIDPHIPMFFGSIFASLIAIKIGYKWEDIESGMIEGITQALQSVIILAIIGILIGVWIEAGVVPSMIYYGLKVLSPKIFLFATAIICSITSLATGTSWGTAGTIGIALMGIGKGLGIPAPQVAGAVITGAYFGDKMSPLSDTTNLAPAMAGTDLFTHIKHMIYTTGVSYIIALILYFLIGLKYGSTNADISGIYAIQDALASQFNINLFLLLPPVVVILCVAMKVPAIPGITIGIILGTIGGQIFQGSNMGQIMVSAYSGYVCNTGNPMIDELLSTGGLMGMMYSISLTILAMMYGGIMEKTKQLEVIVDSLLKRVKTAGGLVTATVLTCIGSNMVLPEQYISIVVPGRMYAKAYRDMGLHPKNLSRTLEDAGTLTSVLVPWNTCGAFMKGILHVSPLAYGPWAFLNYINPIVAIIFGFTGFTIEKLTDDEINTVDV